MASYHDWHVDRDAVCLLCADREKIISTGKDDIARIQKAPNCGDTIDLG